MSSKLVLPQNPIHSEITELNRILRDAGFSEADSKWLFCAFKRTDCFGDPTGRSVFDEEFLNHFEHEMPGIVGSMPGKADGSEKDRQTRLALLFSFLLGLGPVYSEVIRPATGTGQPSVEDDRLVKPEDEDSWIDAFRKGANFHTIHLNWDFLCELRDSDTISFRFYDLIPILLPQGINLHYVVDIDLLDPKPRSGYSSADFKQPDQLEFWFIWRFRAEEKRSGIVNLSTLIPAFSDLNDSALGDRMLGLANAIRDALNIGTAGTERWDPENKGWRIVARELIPFLDLLEARNPESALEQWSLLKAWWHFSALIYGWHQGGLESELAVERKNRLVENAIRHLGLLRATLRDKSDADKHEPDEIRAAKSVSEVPDSFEHVDASGNPVSDFYKKAVDVLLCFAPPWKCLKPLLLAFSMMEKQAVTSDLRAWSEHGLDDPPHPFSLIPTWIATAMYPQNLKSEMKRNPDLRDLREKFADFCLERLRSKKTGKTGTGVKGRDDGFVEERPAWRQCYVQALSALRVNPGGRAHKTLFWLANHDPDESVRKFARKAHKEVRHLDRTKANLDVGASPRRPLFEAFWWLRQAHLMSLDIEIDEAGAQRTRRKELHRTREKNDRRDWEA